MRWLCREKGISANVYSRGVFASSKYVSPKAEDVMLELDPLTKISRHIPRELYPEDIESAGLVLAMEEKHLDDMATDFRLGSRAMRKVFTLKEYAGFTREFDISDPMCMAYEPLSSSLEEGEGNSDGNAYSIGERWKEDDVKALNVYRECRDDIRQCLEHILANPKPDVRAILKARHERARKRAHAKSRHAGALPYGKSSNSGASFWERWDAAKAGGKENQAVFIPGRTYGDSHEVIHAEPMELTEQDIQELNEEWARSRGGGN